MSRYFIEVAYKGTNYSGFQAQQNANTIQDEIEKALLIYFKTVFALTGSSRTDSGVHAAQNYFHFDFEEIDQPLWEKVVYHLNAILPADIVIKGIFRVKDQAHCRFDAIKRTYEYSLYSSKDPFLQDWAFYYPYKLNIELMNEAATFITEVCDFESFSKRNTQVKTFNCIIKESGWQLKDGTLVYQVSGNRFLRGMVRGLVGTMLKVGREKYTIAYFKEIVGSKDASLVDFSVPAHGLKLKGVAYSDDIT
ncbi:MAG: tRNA pseudouridine(38-40) synthase TruA [Ferruginibacter sp.]